MVFTDDGLDVMFYHPSTQAFQELMPDEFHRFEYLYHDWENINSPHGSPFVPGPCPMGRDNPFLGFDGDFTGGGQQLSPVKYVSPVKSLSPAKSPDKHSPTFDFLPDLPDSDSSDNDEEEESDTEDFDNAETARINTAFNAELADEWEAEPETDDYDNAETVRINMLLNAVLVSPDQHERLLGDLSTGSPRKTKKTVRFSVALEEVRNIPGRRYVCEETREMDETDKMDSDLVEDDIEGWPAAKKKRVRFWEEVMVFYIPNQWYVFEDADEITMTDDMNRELAEMAAGDEDKDEDEIWFIPSRRYVLEEADGRGNADEMNRHKVATEAKTEQEIEDDIWL
jgi:hypothetical protein